MVSMSQPGLTTRRIALSVVLAAAVTVSTMLIRVPIPATTGYLNFGDIMIFVSGLLSGVALEVSQAASDRSWQTYWDSPLSLPTRL